MLLFLGRCLSCSLLVYFGGLQSVMWNCWWHGWIKNLGIVSLIVFAYTNILVCVCLSHSVKVFIWCEKTEEGLFFCVCGFFASISLVPGQVWGVLQFVLSFLRGGEGLLVHGVIWLVGLFMRNLLFTLTDSCGKFQLNVNKLSPWQNKKWGYVSIFRSILDHNESVPSCSQGIQTMTGNEGIIHGLSSTHNVTQKGYFAALESISKQLCQICHNLASDWWDKELTKVI